MTFQSVINDCPRIDEVEVLYREQWEEDGIRFDIRKYRFKLPDEMNPDGSRTIGFDFNHVQNEQYEPSIEEIKQELRGLKEHLFGEPK